MNKDDKNRHFVLLIIDISKHWAKEMGHVKMAWPGFVNDVTAWWPGFVQKKKKKKLRTITRIKERQLDWMRLDSALKKRRPQYISTLFDEIAR